MFYRVTTRSRCKPRRAYDHDGCERSGRDRRHHLGRHRSRKTLLVAPHVEENRVGCVGDCQHEAVVDVIGFPADYPVPDVALKTDALVPGSARSAGFDQ